MVADTLPKILKEQYEKYGDKKVALRDKDRGIWQRYTWKDYYEKTKYFFYGLASLGLERGDKLAIIGDAKPEVFWGELAALARGGVVFGIFTDCTSPEVKYFVEHSDCRFALAHDQEQVDKILEIKDEVPKLEKVIYWEPKGMWSYDDPILINFDEVLELGKGYEKEHPGLFEQEIEKGKAEDLALLMYTSGTTGVPKGVMVSFAGAIAYAQKIVKAFRYTDKDEWLAFLPIAGGTGGHCIDLTPSLMTGMTVNFPEEPETVMENIREIGPSGLIWLPAHWEDISRTIQAKMIDAHPLKRLFYHLFLPVGYKVADMQTNKEGVDLFWRALHFLAHLIVFRPLLDKHGLLKLKFPMTGGLVVSPDMLRLMHAIGVNLLEMYASTDFGFTASHRADDIKRETCGPPHCGTYIAMTEEGELLIREDVKWLCGYYKDPELYEQSIKEGWFCSGDAGYIRDDGHVIVMDRMKDLRELKGGRRFSPQYIEARLRFSPFIRNVLVMGGEDRDYVGLIVNMDIENVGRWAEAKHVPYTTFTDLSQKPGVIELVHSEISKVNKNLPEHAKVKRFVNLYKELDADEAELTRTGKIRRTFLEERYSSVIDALYSDKEELEVEIPVTYRDGRKRTIKGAIKVTPVD